MRAGPLRQRVAIQIPIESRDSLGQVLPKVWATQWETWADVRPLNGREALQVKQIQATATHAVTLRYQGADRPILPTARLRLVRSGRILQITSSVNVNERNRTIELVCEESK